MVEAGRGARDCSSLHTWWVPRQQHSLLPALYAVDLSKWTWWLCVIYIWLPWAQRAVCSVEGFVVHFFRCLCIWKRCLSHDFQMCSLSDDASWLFPETVDSMSGWNRWRAVAMRGSKSESSNFWGLWGVSCRPCWELQNCIYNTGMLVQIHGYQTTPPYDFWCDIDHKRAWMDVKIKHQPVAWIPSPSDKIACTELLIERDGWKTSRN